MNDIQGLEGLSSALQAYRSWLSSLTLNSGADKVIEGTTRLSTLTELRRRYFPSENTDTVTALLVTHTQLTTRLFEEELARLRERDHSPEQQESTALIQTQLENLNQLWEACVQSAGQRVQQAEPH